ncbi:MAG: hypothetical protein ABIF40_02055 [archaeon]
MKLKIATLEYPTSAMGTKLTQDLLLKSLTDLSNTELNVIVCPEWGLFFGGRDYPKLTSTYEKDDLVGRLCDLTSRKSKLILPGTMMWETGHGVYNTLPIIANGEYLGDYHKYTNGGSSAAVSIAQEGEDSIKRKGWVQGDRKGKHFQWEGLDCGVEICSDTGSINLNDSILALDLQFLVSCGLDINRSTLKLKKHGIGIYANGNVRRDLNYDLPKQIFQRQIDFDETLLNMRKNFKLVKAYDSKVLNRFSKNEIIVVDMFDVEVGQ